MKIRLSLFVLFFSMVFASQQANAAIRSSAAPTVVEASKNLSELEKNFPSEMSGKWEAKKERWQKKFDKKRAKWTKKAQKIENKRGAIAAGNYLTLCLILFLAALLFFAIGGAVFNIFGSVSALAAAVFFVLWLLDYTGNL